MARNFQTEITEEFQRCKTACNSPYDAMTEFAKYITANIPDIGILIPRQDSIQISEDGDKRYTAYTCSHCQELVFGEDADYDHSECPHCKTLLPYLAEDICELFQSNTKQYLIDAFLEELTSHYFAPVITQKDSRYHPASRLEANNTAWPYSRKQFSIDRSMAEDMFVEFLIQAGCDANARPLTNSPLKPFMDENGVVDTEVFRLFPHAWLAVDNLARIPNFTYKPEHIDIRWYQYPMQNVNSNIPLDADKLKEIIRHCEQYIKQLEDTNK